MKTLNHILLSLITVFLVSCTGKYSNKDYYGYAKTKDWPSVELNDFLLTLDSKYQVPAYDEKTTFWYREIIWASERAFHIVAKLDDKSLFEYTDVLVKSNWDVYMLSEIDEITNETIKGFESGPNFENDLLGNYIVVIGFYINQDYNSVLGWEENQGVYLSGLNLVIF